MTNVAPLRRPTDEPKTEDKLREKVSSEKSQEMVFAVVGYAGSGPGWVATVLAEELKSRNYLPLNIKVSDLINRAAAQSFPAPKEDSDSTYRVRSLQNKGDALRRQKGHRIVAGLAIRDMKDKRKTAPVGETIAFIVDQVKHPEEVEFLRDVYGNSFYLIGILCPWDLRRSRLKKKHKGASEDALDLVMKNDEAGPEAGGQHVRKTLHLSDFFVNNESEDKGPLSNELARFVDIVTSSKMIRPNRQERGMYAAWGAALRSSCLSRQVGAAILDTAGNILSTGTNEVPKFGGGLYPYELQDPAKDQRAKDQRCFVEQPGKAQQCSNDRMKTELYQDIFQALSDKKLLSGEATLALVRESIESTRIKDLVEFSRAVHAEMDAIVSVARQGGNAIADTTLYSTTYPCHVCARHIVAAGITEVVYIEPYPKSLATSLHPDAVTETGEPNKVRFQLFSGVAPRRFATLFEKRENLKNRDGYYTPPELTSARHRDPISRKSYLELEEEIANLVDKLLAEPGATK